MYPHAITAVLSIVNEGTRQVVENPVDRVMREGTVVGLANDTLLLSRSGREIPIEDSGAPLMAADGKIAGAVLVFHDAGAKRAAAAQFRTVADSAPVLIWMTGVDGRATFFNKPWLEFTGRPMAEELGEGWSKAIHPEDAPKGLELYRAALEARQPFAVEYRLRRHDGTVRHHVERAGEDLIAQRAPREAAPEGDNPHTAPGIGADQDRIVEIALTSGTTGMPKLAALGPSIGACCYEVGPDVYEAFAAAGFSARDRERWFFREPQPSPSNPSMTLPARRADRRFFDGWASVASQLEGEGVPRSQIFRAGLCTASHPDLLPSYLRFMRGVVMPRSRSVACRTHSSSVSSSAPSVRSQYLPRARPARSAASQQPGSSFSMPRKSVRAVGT